jgi:uncharacterized protein YecE (DUF72 family)
MDIYVGTAGFDYKDWNGIVYPPEVKKQDRLSFLAQYFDCCEINSSFYGPIRPSAAKEWCRAVSDIRRFLFPVKLYRGFTHVPQGEKRPEPFMLKVKPEEEKQTFEGFNALAEERRLGAVLIQFPNSFKNEDDTRSYLFSLIKKFKSYPLVLEIRHDSWNDPEVLDRLTEEGVGFCNIDQPRIGGLTGTQHATSPTGYVRLHGRNYKEWFTAKTVNDRYNYLYKPDQLKPWTDKIKSIASKTEKTFAVTNNHNLGKAAVNALEIESMLSGEPVDAPEPLVEKYPELKEFVRR